MNFLPLLQSTPNTIDNLVLGLVVIIGLPVLYLVTIYLRRRNALRDLEMIDTLAAEEKRRREAAGARPSAADQPKPSAP